MIQLASLRDGKTQGLRHISNRAENRGYCRPSGCVLAPMFYHHPNDPRTHLR